MTGFDWVLTGFDWVLLGFNGSYWVLPGFTGFHLVLAELSLGIGLPAFKWSTPWTARSHNRQSSPVDDAASPRWRLGAERSGRKAGTDHLVARFSFQPFSFSLSLSLSLSLCVFSSLAASFSLASEVAISCPFNRLDLLPSVLLFIVLLSLAFQPPKKINKKTK